jgi:hypothetical protein
MRESVEAGADGSYISQLLRFTERNGPAITGHICTYSGAVSAFSILER